jgi:hypothetical protein
MARDWNSWRRRQRLIGRLEMGQAIGVHAASDRMIEDVKERRAELKRWVARVSWGLDHSEKLDRAQAAADAAWDRLEAEDPDGDSVPPEQIELERLLEDVNALIDEGRWPAHLHWSL